MNRRLVNKLVVGLGSLLTINGLLLLADPPRFAALRESSWMPNGVNRALDQFAREEREGRTTGFIVAALGALLLVIGMLGTRPRVGRASG